MKACFLFMLMAVSLWGCSSDPVSGKQDFVMMSEADEIAMGQKSDVDVRKRYGVYDSPGLQDYVNRVGQRLAKNSHRPGLQYHFTVVDSPEVNAFALPGGYIYITRGILPYLDSEAELAAVLGHEIGHVTARHAVKQYTAAAAANIGVQIASIFIPEINTQAGYSLINVSGNALLSGYGREHELEADRLGSEYLARTGYDPHAMIAVLSELKAQEQFDIAEAKLEHREPHAYHGLFASHPDSDKRLQEVVKEASTLESSAHPVEGKRVYLEHINGIAFGDNPQEGVVRKGLFLHQTLGIGIRFPNDWTIRNTPSQVYAAGNDAAISLSLSKKFDGSPSAYLASHYGKGEMTTFSSTGLSGAILVFSPRAEAGAISCEGRLYVFDAAARSPSAFDQARKDLESTIKSFHFLSEQERSLAKGLRITVRKAEKGETYQSYAERSPLGRNALGYLRLLNHAYPDGELHQGDSIKLVE